MTKLPFEPLADYLDRNSLSVTDLLPFDLIPAGPGDEWRTVEQTPVQTIQPEYRGLRSRWEKRLQRAYENGWMALNFVDEFCINILRKHPCEIYGDYWFKAAV